MNATRILTLAGDLGRELAQIKDAEERLQTIAAVCTMLADAIDDDEYGTDSANELRNAASNALGNIADVREEEAEYLRERDARMSRPFGRAA